MGKASRSKKERRALQGMDLERDFAFSMTSDRPGVQTGARRPRMSASLSALVRPFESDAIDIEEYRALVGIGVMAWNFSLLEQASLVDVLDELKCPDTSRRGELETMVSDLVQRKRRLFPDDERVITAWDVKLRQDGSRFVTAVALGFE
jgi:hypothetical protein